MNNKINNKYLILPGFLDIDFNKYQYFDLLQSNSKKDDSDYKFESICPICLSTLTNPTRPNECLHFFCYPCLYTWSKDSNLCPYCRVKFKYIVSF